MRITNKYGLPTALVRYLERDTYSRGESRLSVTQIIDSPRVVQLRAKHDHELEEDVSGQLWLILGKAIHHVLEHGTDKADGTTTEERLFDTVEGWTVSGQIDLQETSEGLVISDWKFTSVWSVMNEKSSWTNQLNVYRWLAERKKGAVKSLQVIAFLRDWNKFEAEKPENIAKGYPPAPMKVVSIPMWTMEEADAYVRGRVKAHQEAAIEVELGGELPYCSDEEMWAKEPKWVVRRPGVEKPARVLPTEAEAKAWAASKSDPALVVEKRQAEPARCSQNWCRVAKHCGQWRESNAVHVGAVGGGLRGKAS